MISSIDRRWAIGLPRAIAATILLVALGCTSAYAQWEWVYGIGGTDEGGRRGVRPVVNDAYNLPPGFISTGWSNVAGNYDVYVVRTDATGMRLWEFTYDVTGAGNDDRGRAIWPTYNCDGQIDGYVITGFTLYSAVGGNFTTDVFIVRIDASGALIWARTYGHPQRNEGGHDILVARTGDPTVFPFTNADDIVVAGWALEPADGLPPRMTDGYLLRTNDLGFLVTDAAYDNGPLEGPPTDDIFMALTELTPTLPGLPGDFMAVGITTANDGPRAWALRVDATLASTFPSGGTYGNVGAGFFSVIELRNPADTGVNGLPNVVAVGDVGGATDILAVKMPDGDPRCQAATLEKRIGIQGGMQVGYDVKEIDYVTGATDSLQQWDLVFTGWYDDGINLRDAFFLGTTPAFVPILGTLFNAADSDEVEEGWSIYPDNMVNPLGFVICGVTTAVNPFDPSDLYLINTDIHGHDDCDYAYIPTDYEIATCDTVVPYRLWIMLYVSQCPRQIKQWMGLQICFPADDAVIGSSPALTQRVGPGGNRGGAALWNSMTAGTSLPASISTEKRLTVRVADSRGTVISTYQDVGVNDRGVIAVPTVGLLPGTYNATFDDGSDRQTLPFVVD